MKNRLTGTFAGTLALTLFLPWVVSSAEVHAVRIDHGARDPALSPDDRSIALSLFGHLYVLAATGGDARQITSGIAWDTHPAWSPDGRFLAFSHEHSAGTELIVLNLATGTSTALYHTDAGIGQIAYDPSGERIYFLLDRNQLDCHLWQLNIGDGKTKQITFTENWHEWSFALSSDGKEVLLDSGRFGGSNLYRLTFEGSHVKRLTNSPAHQTSANWSRDGKTLAYIATENGVDSIFVQSSDGGAARRVCPSPYEQKQLTLSRDGSWGVLCAARKLYRLDLTSGQAAAVPLSAEMTIPGTSRPDLIIRNARLFDGTKNEAVPGSTVEIRDGKIATVHPDAGGDAPNDVASIDAAGRFVMSGLIDNHYHYWDAFAGAGLIRNGITSVRDPGVAISSSMTFREANELGVTPGPKIYSCGPLIDGIGGYHPMVNVELSAVSAAAPLVRALKGQGVDCLKVYFLLAPDVLAAVIREAHALKLPVTGHIGVRTGWGEALDANIDGLTHIRVWKDFLSPDKQPQGENETLDGGKNGIARMQADWSEIDPDGEKAGQLIERMLRHKIGFDPTLAIQRFKDPSRARFGLEQFATGQDAYRRMGRFVARAQKAGIPILAGTDDSGTLFDELEAYSEVGIPNAEVLRTATINGAKWLNKSDEFGTIKPGKRADLLLVDGDPLKDIKDLRKVSIVIQNGRVVFER